MTEGRYEMALRHVLRGREIVAAQRRTIEGLRAKGADDRDAEDLLALFLRSQAIFEQDLADLGKRR
jgi:hypothetical protein